MIFFFTETVVVFVVGSGYKVRGGNRRIKRREEISRGAAISGAAIMVWQLGLMPFQARP